MRLRLVVGKADPDGRAARVFLSPCSPMYSSPSIAAIQLSSASRACHATAVWAVVDWLQKSPTAPSAFGLRTTLCSSITQCNPSCLTVDPVTFTLPAWPSATRLALVLTRARTRCYMTRLTLKGHRGMARLWSPRPPSYQANGGDGRKATR